MAVEDALGHAGGAGAVDDVEVVFWIDRQARCVARGSTYPGIVAAERAILEVESDQAAVYYLCQLSREGRDRFPIGGRHDQDLGPGVLQHQL